MEQASKLYERDEQGRITCPHCGEKWIPRVEKPKFCPFCRRPMQKVSSKRHYEFVKPVKAVKSSKSLLVWCENHNDAETTGEKLAMFSYDGHVYCLTCMHNVLTTLEQITLEDVMSSNEN